MRKARRSYLRWSKKTISIEERCACVGVSTEQTIRIGKRKHTNVEALLMSKRDF